MRSLVTRIFGSANERLIKSLRPAVARINELEARYSPLPPDQLRWRATELRERVAKGEPLDSVMPEAFALVREAAKRTLGQRHYDVQLIGGMVLHQGKIAEMKTGEGKTLVATLPSFLNALGAKGVHVVTVNDYLARRDAEWMGAVHRSLGLSVGCIVHGMSDAERRESYAADITYGQNNEFGFDYLRDNMKPALELFVQRAHNYAIVDEVDSILIDEARTPLIISGPVDDDPEKFRRVDRIIPRLIENKEHYTLDEKARSVQLTEEGVVAAEHLLGIDNLYAPNHMETLHVVQNALRAHIVYKLDVDYVVKDDQVLIVDEFTGRLMEGRRWSDGLHQAVEAKEKVKVQNESQTYASITFQNYFRMYGKLAGMTGTADTEAQEFASIYKLDVVVVPTHRPMVRKDHEDVVYRTKAEKWKAVIDDIEACHGRGQPVLVGTIAIETSELVSAKLKNRGIRHNVLNAKQHQREAEIVAQAGRLGAVTISTNMAGRGTDIVLGGNPAMMMRARGLDPDAPENKDEFEKLDRACREEREKVLAAGGLHVLGTERHESRRIDNQLRGRSGRQGDPGSSRFFLSLEDDLLRIFGADRIAGLMKRLGMEEGEAIEARMLSGAIERAQRKVEVRNFDTRKHLLEYDDVMNKQRSSIYQWRNTILASQDMRAQYQELSSELAAQIVAATFPPKSEPDAEGFVREVQAQFAIAVDPGAAELQGGGNRERALELLLQRVEAKLDEKVGMFAEIQRKYADFRPPSFDGIARGILLQTLDQSWKDHLLTMDHLKEGVGLQGYAGKDPKRVYQTEGFELFRAMFDRIGARATEQLFRVAIEEPSPERIVELRAAEEARRTAQTRRLQEVHAGSPSEAPAAPTGTVTREGPKVGRNDPCPCGSGKKFKKCHGVAG
ncbi:MAG: preprotein translocase subunit SecA [Deltaproteobacteria bacterium]|nr:preprotein translocase subunit SecA [Deltaproteobacteria bacterium]